MKKTISMPKDEYTLIPENEYLFQVTDVKDSEKNDYSVIAYCEVVGGEYEGKTVRYRLDTEGDFLWLTKIFLKCLNLPHEGEIDIDTEDWIGRQFRGQVKHNNGYANIKKLIVDETLNCNVPVFEKKPVSEKKEIAWDE